MNKIFCLVFVLLASHLLFSQTEKGRIVLGGGVDMASAYQGDVRSFNMAVIPVAGIFVVKNFVVGGRYSFGVSSTRTFDADKQKYVAPANFTTGVGVFLKYYFGKKQLKGLATANANYLVFTRLKNGGVSNRNGGAFGNSLGFAYFFNKNISLETAFSYNLTVYEKTLPLSRFGFGVGFSFILDKQKPDESNSNN